MTAALALCAALFVNEPPERLHCEGLAARYGAAATAIVRRCERRSAKVPGPGHDAAAFKACAENWRGADNGPR